jgi:hypothetical protein
MIVEPPERVVPIRTPRAGELSSKWRLMTALTWIAVVLALGSVWNVSDQLGLSTWWLGPRGEPRPRVVQLLPFVPAVVMVLAAINHIRQLAWWGVLAAALIVAVGVVDLGYVARLGWVEIAIGVAAGAVSVASRSGTYRPIPGER